MLPRVLEPEVMDTAEEARDYDAMDHAEVNRLFVADLLAHFSGAGVLLDLGTGTAQIPIELCRQHLTVRVLGIDLADHMLQLGQENVRRAGMDSRITLQKVDAKALPFPDHSFAGAFSNSIVHHIPEPRAVLAEMVRVTQAGGMLFVRDLSRPATLEQLQQIVRAYAGGANAHQQKMFADSLRAALTLEEVRALVHGLGMPAEDVRQTSDRHWTWATRLPFIK